MPRDERQMDPATLLCERCGYVIEGLDERGACPECGRPIAESVPERRTGVPIEPGADGKTNWLRGAWAVLTRPGETFERVRIDPRRSGVFASLVSWRIVCYVGIGVAMVIGVVFTPDNTTENWMEHAPQFLLGVTAGCVLAVIYVTVVHVVAASERMGLGIIASVHGWRSSKVVRRCVTDYAMVGWGIGIVAVVAIWVATCARIEFSYRCRQGGHSPGAAGHLRHWWWVWTCAAVLIPLLLFELLCYIGIRRCRFANQPRIRSAVPAAESSGKAAEQVSDARA